MFPFLSFNALLLKSPVSEPMVRTEPREAADADVSIKRGRLCFMRIIGQRMTLSTGVVIFKERVAVESNGSREPTQSVSSGACPREHVVKGT